MKLDFILKKLENREFDELKKVKIKKRNLNLLEEIERKCGIEKGAIIDIALEQIKLEKLLKECYTNNNKTQENELKFNKEKPNGY